MNENTVLMKEGTVKDIAHAFHSAVNLLNEALEDDDASLILATCEAVRTLFAVYQRIYREDEVV